MRYWTVCVCCVWGVCDDVRLPTLQENPVVSAVVAIVYVAVAVAKTALGPDMKDPDRAARRTACLHLQSQSGITPGWVVWFGQRPQGEYCTSLGEEQGQGWDY